MIKPQYYAKGDAQRSLSDNIWTALGWCVSKL